MRSEGGLGVVHVRGAAVEPLHRTERLAVYAVTRRSAPELVRALCELRARAFDRTFAHGHYGMDAYDEWATQVLCSERHGQELLGAVRVLPGWDADGGARFFLHRYWRPLDGAEAWLADAVELGRIWVREGHPDALAVIRALYVGISALTVQRPRCRGLFGTLSVADYPEATCRALANYLYRYHPPRARVIEPREAFALDGYERYAEETAGCPRATAFRRLCLELKRASPAHPVPFLLHVYLKQGAELLGPPAIERGSGKFLLPLYIGNDAFESAAERALGLGGEAG